MNILMMSNTYRPFVGGVERSIEMFTGRLRSAGHRVVIVVPNTPKAPVDEPDILRMPAIPGFNHSDFPVELPIPGLLELKLREFRPDIVHSHHPFFIGDTALRVASRFQVPVVFTFHSFFEHYTSYVPGDSKTLKKYVIALTTGYANLCDQVIAPSESVRDEIIRRGVRAPVTVVPTGIDIAAFRTGNRNRFRDQEQVPRDAFVAGIVSRIGPEKNIDFLAKAVSGFLSRNTRAHFFLIGQGSSVEDVKKVFEDSGAGARCHALGTLQNKDLVDAYHALDLFVYSSQSETQGIVLAEAMAAGLPIAALDAPGVREVVQDRVTGRLCMDQNIETFINAITEFAEMSKSDREDFSHRAQSAVEQFSEEVTTGKLLDVYEVALKGGMRQWQMSGSSWAKAKRWWSKEWELISNMARATGKGIAPNG